MKSDKEPTCADRIALAKEQIQNDIADGLIQGPIRSFEDLYDYVDANMYGLVSPDDIEVGDVFIATMNEIQLSLDTWIKSGGIQVPQAAVDYYLGIKYDTGEGCPEDATEAARCYRLAAEQGHSDAQYTLGLLYTIGRGVPQDDTEASRWIRLAAEQGHATAQAHRPSLWALK